MLWLLESNVWQAMERALAAGFTPTAEQQAQYEASYTALSAEGGPRLLTIAGATAEVSVQGVLTKAPDFLAMLFGGGNTTYSEIISAVAAAEQDPSVKEIVLAIDSPGGSIDGLFDTVEALQNTKKPMRAVVANLAASAAYALASQADTITAANRAVRVGSIGVVASFFVDDSTVQITSTKAPHKRPDVTTKAGADVVRAELDALHDIFVDAIANGRGTTTKAINADFGKGATVLAGEALNKGMIDSITGRVPQAVMDPKPKPARKGGTKSEASKMDLRTFRADHPDVYDAAVQVGQEAERDRVTAHLTAGEQSGDVKTASESIRSGVGMSMTLQTSYMMAATNRADVTSRQLDDEGAAPADATNAAEVTAASEADKVELRLASNLGMTMEGAGS